MKFLWSTIQVKDLDTSISFYTDLLELKLLQRFPAGPNREIAFLGNNTLDETKIELIYNAGNANISFSDCISLGFAR